MPNECRPFIKPFHSGNWPGNATITNGKPTHDMRGSRKFCQTGSMITVFFKLMGDRGSKYRFKWAIIGSPFGVSLAGRCWPNLECWPGSLELFQGIRYCKESLYFYEFSGGPDPLPPPPLDPRMHDTVKKRHKTMTP